MRTMTYILAAMILSLAGTTQTLYAQQTQGYLIFERKINTDSGFETLPEELRKAIQAQKVNKILYFSPGYTLFQDTASDNDDAGEYANTNIRVAFSKGPEDIIFTDMNNKRHIEQRDLMGRHFLVESPIEPFTWKTTGRQKKIIGMECMEAYMVSNDSGSDTTFAWYTTAIPISSGPEGIGGLPGMILELQLGKGKIMYTASQLSPGDYTHLLKAPVKGKKVSKKEYERIQEERIKRMEGTIQSGSGAHFIVH